VSSCGERDTTNFLVSLKGFATSGSLSVFGQNAARMSYVRRAEEELERLSHERAQNVTMTSSQ
jgi:hypothetical protein